MTSYFLDAPFYSSAHAWARSHDDGHLGGRSRRKSHGNGFACRQTRRLSIGSCIHLYIIGAPNASFPRLIDGVMITGDKELEAEENSGLTELVLTRAINNATENNTVPSTPTAIPIITLYRHTYTIRPRGLRGLWAAGTVIYEEDKIIFIEKTSYFTSKFQCWLHFEFYSYVLLTFCCQNEA